MSEREKDIIKTIAEALPNMSNFDKGYFLGFAESRASDAKSDAKSNKQEKEMLVS